MSARRTLPYVVALVLSAAIVEVARADGPAADRPTADRPTVFVVGDSHVRALGPLLRAELDAHGYRFLGYESRPGWSTARYRQSGDLRRLLVRAGRPDVVIVSLGGNDFVGSREEYEGLIRWVIAQSQAAGAHHVVWVGPAASNVDASEIAAQTGARHERNADLQREIVPALGAGWVDSRHCTRHDHRRDGVHFTRDGYTTWCRLVVPKIHAAARLAIAGATAEGAAP